MLESAIENREVRGFNPVYRVEAGLVLSGSEVKALKRGSGRLQGAYLKFFGQEPYLVGLKSGRYPFSSEPDFDPERNKKVLLGKAEISRIFGLLSAKGMVCLPSRVYAKGGFLKVELLVGRSARKWEKREKEKKKEQSQEAMDYLG